MTTDIFIPPYPLKTPVLFLIFNRLDTTKQVFDAIKQAKPPKLYIAADGPRADKEGEKEKVKAVRDYVLENIDWKCEVKELLRDKNLGCGRAVSEAITWFFENEEMGIILEDDCLPSQSFFYFCEILLERYKDNDKVMQINGSCFLDNLEIKESYFFSKYNHIWGWASWRRSWKYFNLYFADWKSIFNKINYFNSKKENKFWVNVFKKYFNGQIDTWDFPWTFSIWVNNGICVYPKLNMVRNIGFIENSTHTNSDERGFSNLQLNNTDINNLIHPDKLEINKYLDELNFNTVFEPFPLWKRWISKFKKIINRL